MQPLIYISPMFLQAECHTQKDYADFSRHTNVPYYIQKKLKTIILINFSLMLTILRQCVRSVS